MIGCCNLCYIHLSYCCLSEIQKWSYVSSYLDLETFWRKVLYIHNNLPFVFSVIDLLIAHHTCRTSISGRCVIHNLGPVLVVILWQCPAWQSGLQWSHSLIHISLHGGNTPLKLSHIALNLVPKAI